MSSRLFRAAVLGCAFVATACGGKSSDAPAPIVTPPTRVGHPRNAELPPDLVCPGANVCPPSDAVDLTAAAAMEVITPTITEKLIKSAKGKPWEFRYSGGDTFDDVNKNGVFDATWIAGFGTGRAAAGVADDQYVRTVVMKQGRTSIAMVSVDCVGFMYEEVARIREQLAKEGVAISYVFVGATHVHEARDTMGIWGVDDATSGLDKTYNTAIREAVVRTIKTSLGKLERANATFGAIEVDGHLTEADPLKRGAQGLVGDGRDPVIIDTKMNTLRLVRAGDKSTIATLVNFGAHPEYGGDRNVMLSSDFADTLRLGVEKGVDVGPLKKPGLGGMALYFQGACGGQIGPGGVSVADATGKEFPRDDDANPTIGLARAKVTGTNLAYYALTSLEAGAGATSYDTMRIGVRARQIFGRIENRAYHVAIVSRYFDRKGFHFDESKPIGDGNMPDLLTEVAVIDLGPASMIVVPGEIFPESIIGGYDGLKHTPAPYKLIQATNKNPPDMGKAPKTGYLYELVDAAAKFKWTLGMGNDEMGYLVPAYDYQLHPADPYYEEPPGDHYEETNSIGPLVESEIIDPLRDLLKTKVPITRP